MPQIAKMVTMPQPNNLAQLFTADSVEQLQQALQKWENCLGQLTTEQIWWRGHPEGNSIGNLALHICGNLRQWIQAGLNGQPDQRDRPREFSCQRGGGAAEILKHLSSEISACEFVLKDLQESDLVKHYTIQGFTVNGLQAVNHTVTHFVGHTHQVITLTRFQLGSSYQFAWSADDGSETLPI